MAFRWRADDGPTLNAGLVALCFFRGSGPLSCLLLRNPIFFCVFFFGGGGGLFPPLDQRMYSVITIITISKGLTRVVQQVKNNFPLNNIPVQKRIHISLGNSKIHIEYPAKLSNL